MPRTFPCVPILHPAAILRGAWAQEPFQIDYLKTALKVAREGTDWIEDLSKAPLGANLFPTQEETEAFHATTEGPYTVDIECAGPHLVCVGICDVTTERYICIRFRSFGGAVYDSDNLLARVSWLYAFLSDPDEELIFHNGQAFDIPYLESIGFKVQGYVDETTMDTDPR